MQNEQTKTNAAERSTTATTTTEATSAKPVTYHDNGEAVTIRISGNAYANLRKVADVMNAASWTDNDNDAAWAVRYWIGDFLDRLTETPDTCAGWSIGDVAEDIVTGIDTGHDEETQEDKARRDELRAAFKAAGLYA